MGSRSLRSSNQSTDSKRRELDGLESAMVRAGGSPRLVETVDGFGDGIVVEISETADRGLHACFSQALGDLIETYRARSL